MITAVELLLTRNGVADDAALTAATGEWPARIGGFIVYDRRARQVRLDREKLIQQFELEPLP